jgi:Polyketide cyclase / dehydrase and lipid transport
VELRSERHYSIDAPRGAVWAALTRVGEYEQWWPWLAAFDGGRLAPGERWRCAVKPPLPYTVRFEIHLVEVVDGHVARAEIGGDIAGRAEVIVVDRGDRSELQLRSELVAVRGMPRLLARWARPIAVRGHDWVLDAGADQFRAALAATTP